MRMRWLVVVACALLFPLSALAAARAAALPKVVASMTAFPPARTEGGMVIAEIDSRACLADPAPCEGLPPEPSSPANANPIRIVVQIATPGAARPLARSDFDVRVQFAPDGAPAIQPLDCAGCFESREGGTYSLWLGPSGRPWKVGQYFLRIGLRNAPSVLPALGRLDISTTAALPPSSRPPVAAITTLPSNEQVSGRPVIFDGSASYDPDPGAFVTMYKWTVTSTNPDVGKPNPIVAEGPGVSALSFPSDVLAAFVNLQDLVVTLLVTDDPSAPAIFASGQPVAYRAVRTIPYSIVTARCDDNTRPTAVIAGGSTQQIIGAPFATVSFLADGTLSSDPETPLETYTWNCGNGSIPLPQGNGSKAVCKYVVDQTPRTYTMTLVVTDRGTGELVGDQYQCAAESLPASIQVVVAPLSGG